MGFTKKIENRDDCYIFVVLHLFVRWYVAVSKAKFAENLHIVLSSPDEIAFTLTSCVF